MTPEEMQAEILRLQGENKDLSTKVKTLTDDQKVKDQRITDLQEHNQKLFLKITDQVKTKEDQTDPEDKPTLSPEEFAKTLKF
jgi:hypothetical protein